jgi:hypothetical protein
MYLPDGARHARSRMSDADRLSEETRRLRPEAKPDRDDLECARQRLRYAHVHIRWPCCVGCRARPDDPGRRGTESARRTDDSLVGSSKGRTGHPRVVTSIHAARGNITADTASPMIVLQSMPLWPPNAGTDLRWRAARTCSVRSVLAPQLLVAMRRVRGSQARREIFGAAPPRGMSPARRTLARTPRSTHAECAETAEWLSKGPPISD